MNALVNMIAESFKFYGNLIFSNMDNGSPKISSDARKSDNPRQYISQEYLNNRSEKFKIGDKVLFHSSVASNPSEHPPEGYDSASVIGTLSSGPGLGHGNTEVSGTFGTWTLKLSDGSYYRSEGYILGLNTKIQREKV